MRLKHAAGVIVVSLAVLVMAACGSSGQPEPTSVASTPPTTPSTTTTTSSSTTTTSSTTSSTSTSTSSSSTAPKPAPIDPITGGKVSSHPVVAAKIDNTSFPQYGIADADVVYTEQVEGGLTRLIAIFHTTLPKEIGPVRSIRSTDMQLLPSYGPILLLSSGGNSKNMKAMRASIMVGLVEGANGFWRSSDRGAPYNLHADVAAIAKSHPKQPPAQSPGFTFGPLTAAQSKTARDVTDIDVSMLAGRTSFTYAKGKYQAFHGGTPYTDAKGKKVTVHNVIVQHVKDEPDGTYDPIGSPAFMTHTTGTGSFTLYRNGKAIDGTWSREKATDAMKYLDKDGHPIAMTPGKTWVLLAPQTSKVHKG